MFEKQIVLDGKGHMKGRLASYIAKELLNGQRITVVRCESINISGSLFRNRVKFMEFLNLRMNHKPLRGFVHYRAPSRIFWRVVRGMIPHRFPRGAAALGKLKVFDGVPEMYATKKRKVIPDALKIVRLKKERKFCKLGDLATSVGWKDGNIISQLEEKRKARANTYYEKKKIATNNRRKALGLKPIKEISDEIIKKVYSKHGETKNL
jgi:large subunit ribosomal protein L13Ae